VVNDVVLNVDQENYCTSETDIAQLFGQRKKILRGLATQHWIIHAVEQ